MLFLVVFIGFLAAYQLGLIDPTILKYYDFDFDGWIKEYHDSILVEVEKYVDLYTDLLKELRMEYHLE